MSHYAHRTAFDTNLLIALMLDWHIHHAKVLQATEYIFKKEVPIVPIPVFTECYSVLTRLPPPHRLSPTHAETLLRNNFKKRILLAPFPQDHLWNYIALLEKDQIAGGKTYDAQILFCAQHAGATRLLTLNDKDFRVLTHWGVEIISP